MPEGVAVYEALGRQSQHDLLSGTGRKVFLQQLLLEPMDMPPRCDRVVDILSTCWSLNRLDFDVFESRSVRTIVG